MTIELLTVFKEVCLSIAAITTAIVAICGLQSWRKELRGKADFDAARGLIRATYKLRDEITYSRSPYTCANEFPEGYNPLNKTAEKEAEAWGFVFTNRWKPIAEAIQEYDAQTLEAESLWGNEIKIITLELKKCSRTLWVAMTAMVSNAASNNENFITNSGFGDKVRAKVWQGWDGNEGKDELDERIDNAVINIEKKLKPYLNRN